MVRHILVTELLEGGTLKEVLLEQHKLSTRKVIDFAVQIANGLSAAHQKGIIHRDLKPDNLFICKGGRVKILDFGLAKLTEGAPRAGSGNTATLTAPATSAGTVLGTVGYMSPEQVRGLPTDARSDMFSFGAILFEMLSGERAFAGASAADISSAILKQEPPELRRFNANITPALELIVLHCLEKDAADRFQSAKDLAFALHSISTASDSSLHQQQVVQPAANKRLVWGGAVALLLIAAALWFFLSKSHAPVESKVVRSQRLTDFVGIEEFPAISPDAKSVAFISDNGGKRQLWVRLLRGGVPLQITHDSVDHLFPRWSHDSASIIYYTPPTSGQQGSLWEISALGGFPRQLTESESAER